jgi:hypothetical protein
MQEIGQGWRYRNSAGSTIVRHDDGRYFWVSTLAPVRDKTWCDPLVFPCDEKGKVTEFRYVFPRRYETLQDTVEGHREVIKHLEIPLWS